MRKIGGITLHSIGEISQNQHIKDNNAVGLSAKEMLTELLADNHQFANELRAAHEVTSKYDDYASTSVIEEWIDDAERRAWFLAETLESDHKESG
ncbi:DNA-binding ferritin-like protein [Neisseria perflava]|nr:DNA-binding ferritin-like protein [Neisseria perflava]MCP1772963.1 DNA-binding ferritin-like protein [Neisseria perflava]